MTELHLDWCSYDAAKYAVKNWHYSKSMPFGKTLKIGVWENDSFIGSIIYARGASKNIGSPFGLENNVVCELQRVALTNHDTPVSRMLSISRQLLTEKCPKMRCIVSFADTNQDHHGGIYQADNWYFISKTDANRFLSINGEKKHTRSVGKEYGTHSVKKLKNMLGTDDIRYVKSKPKYKYAYPLDNEIRQKLEAMSKPYP